MFALATTFIILSHLYGIWIYYIGKKHTKKIRKKTKKKSKKDPSKGSFLWFLILYILLIVFYLSIAGYVPNDDKLTPQNWLGIIGVFISEYSLQILGYSSFLIFFIFIELLVHNRLSTPRKRFLSLIPITLSTLFFTGLYNIGGQTGTLFFKYATLYIGKIGGIFLFGLFALISLLILLEEDFYLPIFKGILKLFSFILKIKNIRIKLPKRKKRKPSNKKDTIDNTTDNTEEENENDDDDYNEETDDYSVIEEDTPIEEEQPLYEISYDIPDIDDEFQQEILDKLKTPEEKQSKDNKFIERVKNNLEKTLKEFGIEGYVENVTSGPVVTRIEFRPASGIRLSKIVNLVDNIALSLETSPVRIEAPIPGKALVGVEIPNEKRRTVLLKEIFMEKQIKNRKIHPLIVGLGKDIDNKLVSLNIAEMPHMIIAGTTGSGKSVAINTIISSLIYRNHPGKVRMIMVDPKRVELSAYNRIPHLMTPVVHDPKGASRILQMAVVWMEERYNKLRRNGVKDIQSYNKKVQSSEEIMPYIVIIIDELADLMMSSPKETESAIIRLAQMARAVGIHLLVATQRPSADVITGLIRSNIPARMAFRVSTKIDSRIILDTNGAESLLGKGDMLVLTPNYQGIRRAQGAFVSADETRQVATLWAKKYLETIWAETEVFPDNKIKETFIKEFIERDIIDAVLWKEEFARNSLDNLLDEMGIEEEIANEIMEFVLNTEYYPYISEEIHDEEEEVNEFQSGGFPYTDHDKRMIKKKYFVPFIKLAMEQGYISARMIKFIGGREDDASAWLHRMQQLGWISQEREKKGPNLHRYKWLNHPDAIAFIEKIEGGK